MGIQTNAEACLTKSTSDDPAAAGDHASVLLEPLTFRSTGEIRAMVGGQYQVLASGKTLTAQRAVSCLVAPECSDVVALMSTREGIFITDVLMRPDEGSQSVTLKPVKADGTARDMVIAAGSLRIDVAEKFEASGKEAGLAFETLSLTAGRLALVGRKLLTSMQEIVSHAKRRLETYDMTTTRARTRVDRIVETDQLRAGSIQTQADTVSLSQSETALVVAKEDIRMDGKRISMG
ncbi:DUF3540 domain-containing protein [Roseibium sp. M-1]